MLQFLIDTLLRATDLALIAFGLSLVYGLVKFPNIAHVQYAMLGAYLTFGLGAAGVPLPLALLLAALLVGALTLVLQRLVFQRLLKSGPAIAMIGSLAIAMLLVALLQGSAGTFPRMFELPLKAPILLGDARITHTQLYFFATTLVLLAAFTVALFHTRLGRAMRALAGNPALANASGLHAARITLMVTFASGSSRPPPRPAMEPLAKVTIRVLAAACWHCPPVPTSTWGMTCSCRCSLRPSSVALATPWVRSPAPC